MLGRPSLRDELVSVFEHRLSHRSLRQNRAGASDSYVLSQTASGERYPQHVRHHVEHDAVLGDVVAGQHAVLCGLAAALPIMPPPSASHNDGVRRFKFKAQIGT